MKKKIAFYLNNPTLPEGDYSSIITGNPGLGGSEYEFLLVPYLLEQRENEIDVYLFVNFKGTFPHKNVFYAGQLYDVCVKCCDLGINLLVVDIKYFDKNVLDGFSKSLSILV